MISTRISVHLAFLHLLQQLLLLTIGHGWPVTEVTIPQLLVVSLDGFRADYVNASFTPNLYALAKDGVQGHMQSAFVTKTYPNHQSIATGLYEPQHGIVNNEFYDPALNDSFNVDQPDVRFWDMNNYSQPIYVAVGADGRHGGSVQWPGATAKYFGGAGGLTTRTRVHYFQDYDKSMSIESRGELALKWLSDAKAPAAVVFLYIDQPDSLAHEYGPFSGPVLDMVRHLDRFVGDLRRKIVQRGLGARLNLIVLSDHGMAEVRQERMLDLVTCSKYFPALNYELHGVSPVFSAIPLNERRQRFATKQEETAAAASMRDQLNKCSTLYFDAKFTAYTQDNIPEIYHYTGNRRILPIFILASDGYDMCYNGTDGWRPKGYPVWGNHGYDHRLHSMRPLFIAHGRSFKRNYTHPGVFQNVDLYPLMLRVLELPSDAFTHHNGSFDRVRAMLSPQLYLDEAEYYQQIGVYARRHNKTLYLIAAVATGALIACMMLVCVACCLISTRQHLFSRARRVRRSASRHSTLMIDYLRHYLANRDPATDQYQMFGTHRPEPIDGSSDDDGGDESCDDHEDVLYGGNNGSGGNNQKQYSGDNRSRNQRHSLTEIDWSIMGTGLDIDLASQLQDRPVMRQAKNYFDHHDGDDRAAIKITKTKVSGTQIQHPLMKKHHQPKEAVKEVKKVKETVSLLMNVDLDEDDDGLCEPPRESAASLGQPRIPLIDF